MEELSLKEHETGVRQEHSGDSEVLHGLGFMLRLQSGGWITLMVIRERAKEGWAGRVRSKPLFFTLVYEFMNGHLNSQWWCQLLLNMAGWAQSRCSLNSCCIELS